MAPENAPVATALPPLNHLPETASLLPPTLSSSHLDPDAHRAKSLKRPRPDSTQSSPAASAERASPMPKSPRLEAVTPSRAVIANDAEASTGPSPNMSESLPTAASATSAVEDKPQENADPPESSQSAPPQPPSNLEIQPPPGSAQIDQKNNTSPTSAVSQSSVISTAGPLSIPEQHPVTIQSQSEVDARAPSVGANLEAPLLMPNHHDRTPVRGMSTPIPGRNPQLVPRSPSQKKHKCPYCETEFTRHHNLKSHLLTHSQEKPYICQTCSMRFRRLHDLKRHTKLHTGERPHICPKCDRKFARGDALARHSKGQGGCAGRRASMGSFAGEEDYDGQPQGEDTVMDGVIYGEPAEGDLSDEDRRRSLPSIKAQLAPGQNMPDHYARARGPSTYPPAGPRPAPGSLYPPASGDRGSSSSATSPSGPSSVMSGHTPNTSVSSLPLSAGSGSVYSQNGGMTESPKPLSPSSILHPPPGHDPSAITRQRSPSHGQYSQQHYAPRSSGRPSSPGLPAAAPPTKMPGLSALAPPEPKPQYALQHQPVNASSTSPHGSIPSGYPGAASTSHAPHHQSSGSGDSSNNLFASGDRGVWTYIQSIEDKMKQLADKVTSLEGNERAQEERIARLVEEVNILRQQAGASSQQPAPNTSA